MQKMKENMSMIYQSLQMEKLMMKFGMLRKINSELKDGFIII